MLLKLLSALALATLAMTAVARAQETDTEKAAAREVLQKMAALEASLDVPALVAKLTGSNPDRDAVVARGKELLDKELLAMADDIATHPEIGFEEKRSIGRLTDYLRQHNFSIETGTASLSTAFVAKFRGRRASPPAGGIPE